ncbi:bactofilin family protein [Nannocystaceae bacterium ST9]
MAAPRSTTSTEDTTDETIVGPAIAIRGRIDGEEDLRVQGRIEGSIALTETLYVEPSGVVIAEVEARDVVVSGVLIGDVTAVNSVTLNKGAKLVGNIRAPRLIIADGASFRGDVAMDSEDAPPPSRERTRATSTVPRAAIGTRGSVATATPTRARAAVSGSYETRRAATGSTASTGSSTPRTSSAAAPAPARPAPARDVAPPARPAAPGRDDDEVTVVVKHSALRKGEMPPDEDDDGTGVRRAKKSARIPARGRRKAGRR